MFLYSAAKCFILQETYYCPYREVIVDKKKKKITPHGHIEERLKTIRKREGIHSKAQKESKDFG